MLLFFSVIAVLFTGDLNVKLLWKEFCKFVPILWAKELLQLLQKWKPCFYFTGISEGTAAQWDLCSLVFVPLISRKASWRRKTGTGCH